MWQWIVKNASLISIIIALLPILAGILDYFLKKYRNYYKNLFKNLNSKNINTRDTAIREIIKKGKRRTKYVTELGKIIRDEADSDKKTWSAYCLLNIGENAKPFIMEIVKVDVNRDILQQAIKKMKNSYWIEYFIKAMEDDKSEYFQHAVIWLMGESKIKKYIDKLAEFNKCQNIDIKKEAISALGKIGTSEAVQALIKFLNNSSNKIRASVIKSLGEIATDNAIACLKKLLSSQNNQKNYENIITAFGEIDRISTNTILTKIVLNKKYNFSLSHKIKAASQINIGKLPDYEKFQQNLDDYLNDKSTAIRKLIKTNIAKTGRLNQDIESLKDSLSEYCKLYEAYKKFL